MEILREAKESDLPGIIELYKQLNPEENSCREEKLEPIWKDIINNFKNIRYFVIETGGGIIAATCNITVIPNLTWGGRPLSVIENVVTHEDYRKRGYGKKVIDGAVDFAKRNNCYKVMFLSNSKRTEAHKFYENLGFNSRDKIGFFMYLREDTNGNG